MTNSSGMSIVIAQIRPHMEGNVIHALHDLSPFPGFTVSEVRGQGRGPGAGGEYRATEYDFSYQNHLQIEVICPSTMADRICDAIAKAAWTGRKGDGITFVQEVSSFARIREAGRPPGGERHA